MRGAGDEHAPIVVAHDGERRQPLFALYRRELAAIRGRGRPQRGRASGNGRTSIGAVEVDFSDRRRQFHNLNTPEDFAAYADVLRSRD